MGVTFLLDTHILLWVLSTPDRIPEGPRAQLADRRNLLLVSAVSALEIAAKVRLGKLEGHSLVHTLPSLVAAMGATVLPVSMEHALLAGSMPWSHRDPFDRLLGAQASAENATLVTVHAASLP